MIPAPGSQPGFGGAGLPHHDPYGGHGVHVQAETVPVRVRGGIVSMFAEGWAAYRRGFRQFVVVWLMFVALAVAVLLLLFLVVVTPVKVNAALAGALLVAGGLTLYVTYLSLYTRTYAIALDSVDRRPGKSSGARWLALLGWSLRLGLVFQLLFYASSRLVEQSPETIGVARWTVLGLMILQLIIWVYLPFAVVDEQPGVIGTSISLTFRTLVHLLVLGTAAYAAFYALAFLLAGGVAWLVETLLDDRLLTAGIRMVIVVGVGTFLIVTVVGNLIYAYVLCVLAALYRSRVGGVAYEAVEAGSVIPPHPTATAYGQQVPHPLQIPYPRAAPPAFPAQASLQSPLVPEPSPFPSHNPAPSPQIPPAADLRFPLVPEPSSFRSHTPAPSPQISAVTPPKPPAPSLPVPPTPPVPPQPPVSRA
ncbi:MAG: hypothetical protein IT198_16585 [Acidimicrobiia bacterium]|nr:hypothetical protein [Acidimicrobiia bacterium]